MLSGALKLIGIATTAWSRSVTWTVLSVAVGWCNKGMRWTGRATPKAGMLGPSARCLARQCGLRNHRRGSGWSRLPDGTTDFSVLQNELKERSAKIMVVAFDLLYLNGRDLRTLPLYERKAVLKKLIADTDVQFSESFEVDGHEMYEHACKTGLEAPRSATADISPGAAMTGLR